MDSSNPYEQFKGKVPPTAIQMARRYDKLWYGGYHINRCEKTDSTGKVVFNITDGAVTYEGKDNSIVLGRMTYVPYYNPLGYVHYEWTPGYIHVTTQPIAAHASVCIGYGVRPDSVKY